MRAVIVLSSSKEQHDEFAAGLVRAAPRRLSRVRDELVVVDRYCASFIEVLELLVAIPDGASTVLVVVGDQTLSAAEMRLFGRVEMRGSRELKEIREDLLR